jgi:hypothetical protein
MAILHLTNGDAAAAGLARSGLPGEVLPWRDLLHDGPVPSDDDLPVFRRLRGEFLASRGWASQSEAMASLAVRDDRLAALGPTDALVLWFEPDLFDQLQLVQVLARMARRAPSARPEMTIVPADCYLGALRPEKFLPLHAARRAILPEDLTHAEAVWRAFTAPAPEALLTVTDQLDRGIRARAYAYDDAVRLPHLAAALRRQLEEYPDTEAGLSRTERQLCEALATGPMTLLRLFQAQQAAESWTWLGDWSFAWYVQRLSDCAHPVVVHENGSRVIAPLRDTDGRAFWERAVQLTPLGQQLVQARADLVRTNGIDRWIGGVQLQGQEPWRWNPHSCRLTTGS